MSFEKNEIEDLLAVSWGHETRRGINIRSEKTEIPIDDLTDGSYVAFVKSKSINQPIKFNKLCAY